jgi:hypothetical protein
LAQRGHGNSRHCHTAQRLTGMPSNGTDTGLPCYLHPVGESAEAERERYAKAWRQMLAWRLAGRAGLAVFVVANVLQFTRRDATWRDWLLVATAVGGALSIGGRVAEAKCRCPRCDKPYHWRTRAPDVNRNRCVWCALRRGAVGDHGPSDPDAPRV